MKLLSFFAAAGACALSAWTSGARAAAPSAELKTPETSRLFVRHADPQSGVVSYLLKPGSFAFNQQSFYFTAKSMTDDGRFLVFDFSDDEFKKDGKGRRLGARKQKAVIDFLKDEIIPLPGTSGSIPYLDPKTDQMWFMDKEGVHRRDFLVDPTKDVLVCPVPPELVCKTKGCSTRYGTHVTLSPDHRLMFLDSCVDFQDVEGTIDLTTGKWTEWWRAPFDCNHGQFNPVDPTMAMCAWERARFKVRAEMTPAEIAQATFGSNGRSCVSDLLRPGDDVYPRLWLFRKGEAREVTSRITGYATHEFFAEDGKGFYWCSGGVCYHDLATGRQWRINPLGSAHASMDASNRYIVSDCSWGGWWRGCGWSVLFWNRETHRGVYIHSKRPRIASQDDQSKLHPDPHPQFVCNARYAICTMADEERRLNLSVTPVAPLVARTTDPKTAPAPKRFPLAWDPSLRTDAICEMEVDVRALREAKLVSEPPCAASSDSYTALALRGVVVGREKPIAVEAVQGSDYQRNVVLRFRPPKGLSELVLVADAPGRFEYCDSETCDNLMPDAYQPENAARWRLAGGATTERHRAGLQLVGADGSSGAYEAAIPAAVAGKPVKFELDLRNLGVSPWCGDVRLRQLDGAGRELAADVLGGQALAKSIKPASRREYRLTGKLDPAARAVRLEIVQKTSDGQASRVLVHRLGLREAAVVPCKLSFAGCGSAKR